MDEVQEFCIRVLGPGQEALDAAREAVAEHDSGGRWASDAGRVHLLAAAARACHARAHGVPSGSPERQPPAGPEAPQPLPAQQQGQDTLQSAIAAELASASARLPGRQREALALRDGLRLSYEEIGAVLEIEPAAVAPLLARARLRLRAVRRGVPEDDESACGERERALRLLSLRQDAESMSAEEDRWLLDHLAGCGHCQRAHAAMLEASSCYRAWRLQ